MLVNFFTCDNCFEMVGLTAADLHCETNISKLKISRNSHFIKTVSFEFSISHCRFTIAKPTAMDPSARNLSSEMIPKKMLQNEAHYVKLYMCKSTRITTSRTHYPSDSINFWISIKKFLDMMNDQIYSEEREEVIKVMELPSAN